jgi:hypothetical protein
MKTAKSKETNLIDMIVVKSEHIQWRETDDGVVEIIILRNGFVDRFVRLFRNTPKTFTVRLDEYGSFVWNATDGRRRISEIGEMLFARFGSDIEPIYERLVVFLNALLNNRLIALQSDQSQ